MPIFSRNTDNPQRLEPLRVATTAAEARIAALDSVESVCGDCGRTWRGHTIPADHKCKNLRGQDLGPMKIARAAAAAQQLAAVRRFAPSPPCRDCGAAMPSGVWHECTHTAEPLPHQAIANAWQRKGSVAALAQELAEVKDGPS